MTGEQCEHILIKTNGMSQCHTGILPAVHEDIKLKYHARLHEARALRDRSSLGKKALAWLHLDDRLTDKFTASVHFKASDALMKHEITDECVSQYIVNHINVVRVWFRY